MRQYFVFDLYEFERLLGRLFVYSRYRGNLVSHQADLLTGEVLLIPDELSVLDRRQVLRGDNRLDSRQTLRLSGIDAFDPGMGVGASENLPYEDGSGKTHVGAEDRLAGDLLSNLDSGVALTNHFILSFSPDRTAP